MICLVPLCLIAVALLQHCNRLERDEDVSLTDRIQRLTKTRHELEDCVSTATAQFSEIETIHRDISSLFVKLNQIQRAPREIDGSRRIVSTSG